MKEYRTLFRALSDATRLRIMAVLIAARKELCICEIMDTLQLAQYHVSRHIKELKVAGLVQERKEGRFVFYSLSSPADRFHAQLLKTLETLTGETGAEDNKRLQKRLALREDDKCVVGMPKCTR